jgi:hypothetical protein
MMTFEEGLISTCLLPLFSALNMLFRASLSTLIRTMVPGCAAQGWKARSNFQPDELQVRKQALS